MASLTSLACVDESPFEDVKRSSLQGRIESRESRQKLTSTSTGLNLDKPSTNEEARPEETLASPDERTPTAPQELQRVVSNTTSIEDNHGCSADNTTNDPAETSSTYLRARSDSNMSESGSEVNWEELQKTEDRHVQEEGSEEAVDFLLARLDQENNALATNPKSALRKKTNRQSRPPSMHHLRCLINGKTSPESDLHIPSPPPMTELDFWAAMVKDYTQTAQRLPTLTSNKIRAGIPPPLRGVAWVSMARARDSSLETAFDKLLNESSPYENIIGKDIGRSFPGVDMFREANGDGQKMLGRVLKCFSLYDEKIGYCQGLGFLVGSLLMQMGDKEAFCALVRLMEDYDLRSCYLPDLSGLHLRIYQFQLLLERELPDLAEHLARLNVEPTYLSQWFLSFFAASCPLHLLFRIFDVIFAEGASETLMRVALAVMRKNQGRLLALREFEDVMHILLSRSLWDPYGCTPTSADDLVNDFTSLSKLITRAKLHEMENNFKEAQESKNPAKAGILPGVQATASRFLGRLWSQSNVASARSASLTPGSSTAPRPVSYIRRTASKQSLASTLDSVEGGSDSSARSTSTALTYDSMSPQESHADVSITKPQDSMMEASADLITKGKKEDNQIEDLLIALSSLQREHAVVVTQLQRECENRIDENQIVSSLINRLKLERVTKTNFNRRNTYDASTMVVKSTDEEESDDSLQCLIEDVDKRVLYDRRRSHPDETKEQIRGQLTKAQKERDYEASRARELACKLAEQEQNNTAAKDQLRETRLRLQDNHRDKQRLERTINELRTARKGSGGLDMTSAKGMARSPSGESLSGPSPTGLREFKLSRHNSSLSSSAAELSNKSQSPTSQHQPCRTASPGASHSRNYSRRASSLATHSVFSSAENHSPMGEDALLLELVNAKTAEATALQELEELKCRFEALKKATGATLATKAGNAFSVTGADGGPLSAVPLRLSTPITPEGAMSGSGPLTSPAGIATAKGTSTTPPPSSGSAGPSSGSGGLGFFGAWGRRATSSSNVGSAPK